MSSTAANLINQLSMSEQLQKLKTKAISSVELVDATLAAIETHDGSVGAFLQVYPEQARAQAASFDERRARGETVQSLAGLPIAIKDNMCRAGDTVTCASRMLHNYRPPYTAGAIERLERAGAIIVGRTNLDEFAMGSSGENSAVQLTRNPWDLERTPGGSSSGSAASVAARYVSGSLGSDTGGSIRQPAGLCGVVGLKPTYGRVSRYGLIAFASSLDQIGPFATDVTGAAILLEAISGHDPRDSTSVDVPVPPYSQLVQQPLAGLRVGFCPAHFSEGLDQEVAQTIRQALTLYRKLGAEVKEIALPHADYSVAAYYLIAPSEASSNLSRYDGIHYGYRSDKFENLADLYAASRGEGFGPEVKRRIMLGTYALSAGYYDQYYARALKVRRLIRRDYDEAFQEVDVIAGPVAPTTAFRLGEKNNDPLAMYLSDIYTIGTNLAGIPAISLPAGYSKSGLPIGLQLQGPAFEEIKLLQAAYMFEQAAGVLERKPGMVGG